MPKQTTQSVTARGRSQRPVWLWCLLMLSIAILSFFVSCSDEKSVIPIYADDHIARYIRDHHIGAQLFRTEGLFPSNEFAKPTDPGAMYREFVDSSYRRINIDVTEDADFGAPYNDLDFAELTVLDNFRIRTERTVGADVDTSFDWRAINRFGLFWRLNSADQEYGGWVLHAFNGSAPRDGSLDGTVVETGETFWADVRNLEQIRYNTYEYKWKYDSVRYDTVWVKDSVWALETMVHYTNYPYQPLDSAEIIGAGHHVALAMADAEADAVYQMMTVRNDTGDFVRLMYDTGGRTYADTIIVPHNDPGQWNLVLFRTFLSPDRWGGAWIVPYRTAE